MVNINKKPKKLIIALVVIVSITFALINLQTNLLSVSAIVIPVEVSINHLNFGTVFPGENLSGDFIVTYAEIGDGIEYRIVQRRKPLGSDHPEYPDGGDPLMPGYYRNLCPYLTKISSEGEGDTESKSFVGPNDITDKWTVYFSVPAIMGNVAQDHDNGIVTENGEYGCDIVIEVDEFCGDGIVNGNEQCDDGNSINDDGCQNDCTIPECIADLDFIFIMDRSGSMGYDHPTRLSQAKTAANNFISNLELGDQSALVSYSTTASVDKTLSGDHTLTQTIVNSLQATGATNIGDAISLSIDEFSSLEANPDAAKIAILLTDGKANKPNGPGYGEHPADVAYAEAQAQVAAAAGIKIFTIGLGTNVNTVMLENIAAATNAEYYFAPSGAELDAIISSIEAELCKRASISGCKYNDSNNDGIITGEETIPGWKIELSGDAELSTITGKDGCYTFSNLKPGEYTVAESENQNKSYTQTYPLSLTYNITLYQGQHLTGYDFGNCQAILDIAMVIDVSGSMAYDNPSRLSQAQIAANQFINNLGPPDQSSLVSYSTLATINKPLSNDHILTNTQINSLAASGATNIGDAIAIANAELTSPSANPNALQAAILLTDGKANKPNGNGYGEDPADVAYAETQAQDAANANIQIYTIGLGSAINATMLENIAATTGGQYYFAPTTAQLKDIFAQINDNVCQ